MPERVKPKVTANVRRTFDIYEDSPDLILALHGVLGALYKKAHVRLSRAEKSALIIMIGQAIAKGVGGGGKN